MPTDTYWLLAAVTGWFWAAIFTYVGYLLARELRKARERLAKFDHDGDGKPGGSLKRF